MWRKDAKSSSSNNINIKGTKNKTWHKRLSVVFWTEFIFSIPIPFELNKTVPRYLLFQKVALTEIGLNIKLPRKQADVDSGNPQKSKKLGKEFENKI